MRTTRCLIASLPVLLALAGGAAATVVLRLDLPGLVARADLIVEGRCLSTRAVRDAAGGIATEVHLAVTRGFRGARAGEVVRFAIPGGELDGRMLVLPGMPRIDPGAEVLLFLTPRAARGTRVPVGLGQGRLLVTTDPGAGRRTLSRALDDLELHDAATGRAAPGPAAEQLDYETFTAELQRLVAEDR